MERMEEILSEKEGGEKNPVKIPLCIMYAGALRAKCGVEQGADFETVGITDLDRITCKKCRDELSKRLKESGW